MSTTSRPFIWPTLGLIAGMVVANALSGHALSFLAAAFLWLIAVGVSFMVHAKRSWGVCTAAFFLGSMLMANALSIPPGHIAEQYPFIRGKEVQCRGMVISSADIRSINGIKRESYTVALSGLNKGSLLWV